MAHIWQESFDYFATAQLALRYDSVGGGNITAAAARTGTGGWAGNSSSSPTIKLIPAALQHATLIVGMAIRTTGNPNIVLFQLYGDGTATTHVRILPSTSGELNVQRGTTTIGTTPALITEAWNYFEFKITLHDTTGSVEIRRNGVTVYTLTNVDTKNGGTGTVFSAFGFMGQQCYLDDIYVANPAGTVNNDFYGDTEVVAQFPNGAGDVTQLTPTGSATNWQNVDEATPSATDYNSATTDGLYDVYTHAALPNTGGIIRAVATHMHAQKVGTETKYIRAVRRRSATNYQSASIALGTGAIYHTVVDEVDPATSAAWTEANYNSTQFGAMVKDS